MFLTGKKEYQLKLDPKLVGVCVSVTTHLGLLYQQSLVAVLLFHVSFFSWVKVLLLVSDEERNFRKAVELQTFRLLRFRLNYFFQTDCLMFCQEYQNLKERRRWFFNLFSKYIMKILQLCVSLVGLIRYDCKSGSKVFSITLPVNTKRRFLN